MVSAGIESVALFLSGKATLFSGSKSALAPDKSELVPDTADGFSLLDTVNKEAKFCNAMKPNHKTRSFLSVLM